MIVGIVTLFELGKGFHLVALIDILNKYNISTKLPSTSRVVNNVIKHFGDTYPFVWNPFNESKIQLDFHRSFALELMEELQVHGCHQYFYGNTTTQLNAFVRHRSCESVHIKDSNIQVTEPIRLESHLSLIVDENVIIYADTALNFPIIIGENIDNVIVIGFEWKNNKHSSSSITFPSVIYLHNVSRIVITDLKIMISPEHQFAGRGIILNQAHNIQIKKSHIQGCQGGIVVSGHSERVLIEGNMIEHSNGYSNLDAAIVITWLTMTITGAYLPPSTPCVYDTEFISKDIFLRTNTLRFNRAQGIYLDGIYHSFVMKNEVYNNTKEGICNDNGSGLNYLAENEVSRNGYREHMTEATLRMDYIHQYGLLPDGSSPIKLPGISIDNTAFNVLQKNQVMHNAGGGIKAVRTAYANILTQNTIIGNRYIAPQTEYLPYSIHFGILFGSAGHDLEDRNECLDFTGGGLNWIRKNHIHGHHVSGIQFSAGSTSNAIEENTLIGEEVFGIDDVSNGVNLLRKNHFLNYDHERTKRERAENDHRMRLSPHDIVIT